MEACTCEDLTLGNTGRSGCEALFNVMYSAYYMNTYASDGTRNHIDLTTPLTQAILDQKINEADPTKRWYPLGKLEEVGGERTDNVFDESSSGSRSFVKNGTRTVTAIIKNQTATFMGELETARCSKIAMFFIDKAGRVRGMGVDSEPKKLFPVMIEDQSFATKLMLADEENVEKIEISFQYDQREQDSSLRVIDGSSITADLLGANGLFGIDVSYSNISTSGFDFTLTTKYGNYANLIKDKGLLISELFDVAGGTGSSLYNITTSSALPILTLTENDGVYTVTFAAQTANDVIRLTPVRNGRNYSKVTSNPVTLV